MEYEMIPLDRISISTFNVRADEYFGDEEDQELIDNIESLGVLNPIIVRQVGDMYELLAGRRRLLSAKKSGLSEIPCTIKDVDDDEALDISISENLFRKDVDPVTTGRALKRRIKMSNISMREYARRIGTNVSTLSEFIRMTDLSPDMQNEVKAGKVTFRDALKLVRMNLPLEKQNELAKEAKEGGPESFKKALDLTTAEHETRGAPKDLLITRINWGLVSPEYEALKRWADEAGIKDGEYCQKILIEHIQSRKG